MPRGINQVEPIDLSRARGVFQRDTLRLDGDTAFTLQIHGIKYLVFHLALAKPPAQLDKTVSQRGLAVIDMRND